LAAVHYLLSDGLEHPLADVYAGRSDADPGPLFVDVCRAHGDALGALLVTHRLQTNECGRSALIGPALTWIAGRYQAPLALVDVGASAGLNLLADRYHLDYGPHGATGAADSPVGIRCQMVGGVPPIATRLPTLAARIGIDRDPVDLSDADGVRWLLACVWPDTGRLERTAAALQLAQADPPEMRTGDANQLLPGVLADLPDGAVAVVTTTWTFAYLTDDQRRCFVARLADAAGDRSVVWVSAEGVGIVEGLGAAEAEAPAGSDVLGAIIFEHGGVRPELLGYVQRHGAWIDWRAQVAH
jgi:hypothetical protein